MTGTHRRLLVVPGVLLLIAAGVFAALPIGNELARDRQIANADTVEATVLSTNATRQVDSNAGQDSAGDEVYWSVRLRYRYTVDGATYESTAVTPPGAFGGGTALRVGNESAAEAFLDDYEPNTTTTAHYPPGEPSRGFLLQETTPPVALAIPAVLGSFVAGVGAALIAFGTGLLTLPRR
ncbi:MAG: hypothetical protein ACI8XM_002748 [Haloarculaceae archaeon]|jgi:hypothetical protein